MSQCQLAAWGQPHLMGQPRLPGTPHQGHSFRTLHPHFPPSALQRSSWVGAVGCPWDHCWQLPGSWPPLEPHPGSVDPSPGRCLSWMPRWPCSSPADTTFSTSDHTCFAWRRCRLGHPVRLHNNTSCTTESSPSNDCLGSHKGLISIWQTRSNIECQARRPTEAALFTSETQHISA